MDFHGLARRQLQALCKQNKIPANTTNVAMADELSALDHIEGLEEIMQHAEVGSPDVFRTATRTSTKARKPPVSASQSRARTGRKLVVDDSFEDEKKDVAKTPAVVSSRKPVSATASRRKVEVPSVQKVYSTRRSVRLIEKQLSELCLGESVKRTQPIKIDEELSGHLGEEVKMDVSGKCAEKLLENEVKSCQVSTQTVEAVKIDGVVQCNKVPDNGMTELAATEEVVKGIPEDCAVEVVGSMYNARIEEATPEKIVEQEHRVLEVVQSKNLSDVVPDLLIKEEMALKSAAENDNAVGSDCENDLAAEMEQADNEVMKSGTEADKHDADLPASIDGHSDDYPQHYSELKVAETKTAPNAVKDVLFEEASSETPLPVATKEENGTTLQVDDCDQDTDSMTGQMGSPYSFSELIEDSAEDSKPQDSVKSSIDYVEKVEYSEDKEQELGNSKLDSERHLDASLSTEASYPVLGTSLHPKGQHTAQRNSIKGQPFNKENIASFLQPGETPTTPLENMSVRKLKKMLKGLKISDKEKEGDEIKDIVKNTVTPRQALKKLLPDNTQI